MKILTPREHAQDKGYSTCHFPQGHKSLPIPDVRETSQLTGTMLHGSDRAPARGCTITCRKSRINAPLFKAA